MIYTRGVRAWDFQANPNTVAKRVGEEIVLVNLETNQIYAMNRTAARFWELASGGAAQSEIERQLLAEFQVTREQLVDEIEALLVSIENAGLIGGSDDV